jgi:alpha-L-fucosidase 2
MAQEDNHTIEWTFPLPRTHCGVAMGNGNFGALVWGKERLCITVNRADFWDHRGGELLIEGTTYERLKAAYDPEDSARMQTAFIRRERPPDVLRSSRLPVGRFEFALAEGFQLRKAILHCQSGRLSVVASDRSNRVKTLMLVLGPKQNLLFIEDLDDLIARVIARPSWEWVGDELSKYAFQPPEIVSQDEIEGWVQDCPDDPSLASVCKRWESGFAVCLALEDDGRTATSSALDEIDRTAEDSIRSFLETNDQWWQAYWQGVPEIDVPSEFFMSFMNYALYKFACATNPNSPLPAGLQGPWIEEYQLAPWSGDYHFNVNIQQIYTLAFNTQNLSHLLPLFDMVDSFRDVMQHNACVLHGIDDGLTLAHAVDDRGYACGGISAGSSIDHAVSGWTAQLYWLYYKHTLDEAFLRERAYPFMLGVMRVYEEMLEEDGDRLSIPISISAEYAQPLPDGKRQNVGKNPSYQLACMHMLIDALQETCEILDLTPRPIWQMIEEKVPPYTLIGDEEEEHITIWEGQDLEICHRHHSHLAAIYPFDTLGEIAPETQLILDNSIDHWILKGMGQWSEWCIPWAAILQARMGFTESPLLLLDIWREIFINESMTTVYLPRFRGFTAHRRADMLKPKETSEIMQLDGCMAGATAIYEMLVHRRGDVTVVFPAISEKWKNVSFKNIAQPGAFLVGAERRDGCTQSIEIRSSKGGTLHLAVPDCQSMILRKDGREQELALPATIEFLPGDVARLSVE